jgi:hypothetical protein
MPRAGADIQQPPSFRQIFQLLEIIAGAEHRPFLVVLGIAEIIGALLFVEFPIVEFLQVFIAQQRVDMTEAADGAFDHVMTVDGDDCSAMVQGCLG